MELHFIKAPCHQGGGKNAPDLIKSQYDYEIKEALFKDNTIDIADGNINICPGYELLYQYIKKYYSEHPKHKIITIGGDHSISLGTIAAINEQFMKQNGLNCESDLFILWIDSEPDIYDPVSSDNKNLNEMVMAGLLGLIDIPITTQKLSVNPSQILYFGISDNLDSLPIINRCNIPYLSANKINSIKIENIVKYVKDMIGDRPLHISLDLKVFNKSYAPCVTPQNNTGIKLQHLEILLESLKNLVVSMDIVEFNPEVGTTTDVKTTLNSIHRILIKTFDMKEKSINIFTDDSWFLIFRPAEQVIIESTTKETQDPIGHDKADKNDSDSDSNSFDIDENDDIGWYILRGLSLQERDEILKKISDNTIIRLKINNDEYLIAKTNMIQQNHKSYYATKSIHDMVLFPEEKKHMMFELVNTFK